LVFRRTELDEQVENLVHDFFRPLVLPVDFVDDHDRFQFLFERLAQHIFGLRHRPFESVHQQQYTVHHVEHALHLAAKVGMARGVNDVDLDVVVKHGGILGQNRNAPFALQIVGVHDALRHIFIGAEYAALFQHRIDQRRLTVVNMGDNRHIS